MRSTLGALTLECESTNSVTLTLTDVGLSSGRLALSADEELMAVSNLYDGFDLYNTSDQTHLRTFQVNTHINVPLPVLFIEGASKRVVTGTSAGQVRIIDVSGDVVLQELNHNGTSIVPTTAQQR
ncbi:hypothetical protein L226DRAFT_458228 [Lentinus tigrinus ALCF2SS1-7]|uniref:uncharacterized protein n=1 Tax=Lentinus tigrinus ALCF2SS1-7 TaxID=1328758 RepID=UPI001165F5DB|nr:hypothetical protein L226DRAFT_458228 [Lentinus tigrinus ALCF2SS1-7]